MSGFETAAASGRQFPSTRVVAMSSAFTGDDVPAAWPPMRFYPKATDIFDLLQDHRGGWRASMVLGLCF